MRWSFRFALVGLVITGLVVLREEMHTSRWQAGYFSQQAQQMHYAVAPGVSEAISFPRTGPYDRRLGYTQLDSFSTRLLNSGYQIESQARLSPVLLHWMGYGITPPYHEKAQTGLTLLQRDGSSMFRQQIPGRVLQDFAQLPALVVDSLLFIESRELLDPARPLLNPALEWDRLGKALLEKGQQLLGRENSAAGGSTLATQLEKFRHSPDGITHSTREKLRQMLSASLRAYRQGPYTLPARQQIVVDYLNGVPLAASRGYGEVIGLGDALWVWYGADLHTSLAQLRNPAVAPQQRSAQALAFKQILSLFIAHRRPSEFLIQERQALAAKTDLYLRLLHEAGVVSNTLYAAALPLPLSFRTQWERGPEPSLGERKALNTVRYPLINMLEVPQLYDLERLDLTVKSTLDLPTQITATETLRQLHDPEALKALRLTGKRLLNPKNDPKAVLYSLVLYEKTPQGNVLRVQTDNYDQPLDINDGVKLDLGSTAKLRTLITYLQLVAETYARYEFETPETLRCLKIHPQDAISRWVVETLRKKPDISLKALLEAALMRPYSANSGELFFTGGALHSFHNFGKTSSSLPLLHAFRNSVNLVFIRLMRDIVRHYMYRPGNLAAEVLSDPQHPQRQEYLARYAEREGEKYLRRYYRKYGAASPEERWERLLGSLRDEPRPLAAVHRYLHPQAPQTALQTFLEAQLPNQQVTPETLQNLYQEYAPNNYDLAERATLLRLHPLELWVFAYLQQHPTAKLREVIAAGGPASRQAFAHLTRSKRKKQQDNSLRRLLEIDAYAELHQAWQALGYPFAALVPSYATALGSSADRPGALAELMGILANDGVKLPTYRIEWLHFAADTPYETRFNRPLAVGERVMPVEVARVTKQALYDVVRSGTARAASNTKGLLAQPIRIGGKTGTGDHRREVFGRGGRLLRSQVISRTATFVFMLDERFFGAIVAYVPGEQAGKYQFTSALAVNVLRQLLPSLQPLLTSPPATEPWTTAQY